MVGGTKYEYRYSYKRHNRCCWACITASVCTRMCTGGGNGVRLAETTTLDRPTLSCFACVRVCVLFFRKCDTLPAAIFHSRVTMSETRKVVCTRVPTNTVLEFIGILRSAKKGILLPVSRTLIISPPFCACVKDLLIESQYGHQDNNHIIATTITHQRYTQSTATPTFAARGGIDARSVCDQDLRRMFFRVGIGCRHDPAIRRVPTRKVAHGCGGRFGCGTGGTYDEWWESRHH
jgi:hypothetical protein